MVGEVVVEGVGGMYVGNLYAFNSIFCEPKTILIKSFLKNKNPFC